VTSLCPRRLCQLDHVVSTPMSPMLLRLSLADIRATSCVLGEPLATRGRSKDSKTLIYLKNGGRLSERIKESDAAAWRLCEP
jgi:hypothetical protein